jgi:hypothetical protein
MSQIYVSVAYAQKEHLLNTCMRANQFINERGMNATDIAKIEAEIEADEQNALISGDDGVGNTQNSEIRNILARLGYAPFSEYTPQKVKAILKQIQADREIRELLSQELEQQKKREHDEFMSHSSTRGYKYKNAIK